jgi:uncharacterized protein (TIGR03435 family)
VKNGAVLVVAIMLMGLPVRSSQDGPNMAQGPVFDSISIKRNSQGSIDIGGGERLQEGYIQCRGVDVEADRADPLPKVGAGGCGARNATVKELINAAYQIRPSFPRAGLSEIIAGGPSWAEAAAFDIDARVNNTGTTTRDQFLVMLQNLLRDRFRLRFHRETRDVNGLALVVARRGHKLKSASGEQEEVFTDLPALEARRVPVPALANLLAHHLGTFVDDQTGLTGLYSFMLEWAPDPAPDPDPAKPVATSGTPSGPPASLVTALEDQLGLRLETIRTKWDVLVIDGLAQPTIN